jgi:thiosulfate dehydrogenase [quinone] large subunit
MDTELAREEAARLPLDSKLTRGILAAVRIGFGLLWITQLSWKGPPGFETLKGFTAGAVRAPVLAPYSFIVEHLILPNFTPFGYMVLLLEAGLGAFLVLGLATRFWALVGVVQTIAISLSILNLPHEWSWAYYMMGMGHLAIFATAAGRSFGLDGLYRSTWLASRGRLARWLVIAS